MSRLNSKLACKPFFALITNRVMLLDKTRRRRSLNAVHEEFTSSLELIVLCYSHVFLLVNRRSVSTAMNECVMSTCHTRTLTRPTSAVCEKRL